VRRALLAIVAVVALVGGTTSVAAADQHRIPLAGADVSGTAAPHAQLARKGAALHYGVPTANCGQPAPGHKTCLSERIVPATKGTPGAFAYTEPKAATAGPAGGYTPADLAAAYGFDPKSAVGATQTVAIVDAQDDPDIAADLNAFDAHYGLHGGAESTTSFRKVNQAGASTPLPSEDDGWAGEIALDVEAVRAVCNECNILLVEADSTSNADFDAAVNTAARLGATEISNSYGGAEYADGTTTSSSADMAAYNHPGVVITAASGDDGWYDWDWANVGYPSDNAPEAPASYPSVVAVGGTALSLAADGARAREVVWNEDGPGDQTGLAYGAVGASGGGCSVLYAAPSFQAAVKGYASVGCGSKRATNDIAALADPLTGFDVLDSTYSDPDTGDHWSTVGGTSLASPLIAAMWALAGGSGGVAYPAENLYDHLRAAPSSLYDVTVGSNGFCGGDDTSACEAATSQATGDDTTNPNGVGAGLLDCSFTASGKPVTANRQCNAGPGYDGPSGVGTPKGLAAFRPVSPTAAVAWPAPIKPGAAVTFRVSHVTDPVMDPSETYTWAWGDGTITTTKSVSAAHRYARAGTYTVSLRVADQFGHSSAPILKRYVAGRAPVAKVKGPTRADPHKRVTFEAVATDPNTGGRIIGYTWRVGHKVVGHGKKLKYRFAHQGRSKVRLTVIDNSGLSVTSKVHKVKVR